MTTIIGVVLHTVSAKGNAKNMQQSHLPKDASSKKVQQSSSHGYSALIMVTIINVLQISMPRRRNQIE